MGNSNTKIPNQFKNVFTRINEFDFSEKYSCEKNSLDCLEFVNNFKEANLLSIELDKNVSDLIRLDIYNNKTKVFIYKYLGQEKIEDTLNSIDKEHFIEEEKYEEDVNNIYLFLSDKESKIIKLIKNIEINQILNFENIDCLENIEKEETEKREEESEIDDSYDESYDPDVDKEDYLLLKEKSLSLEDMEQTFESTLESESSKTYNSFISSSCSKTDSISQISLISNSCESSEQSISDQTALINAIVEGVVSRLQNKDYIDEALRRHNNRKGDSSLVYNPLEYTQYFRKRVQNLESDISSDFTCSDNDSDNESDNEMSFSEGSIHDPRSEKWDMDSDSDYISEEEQEEQEQEQEDEIEEEKQEQEHEHEQEQEQKEESKIPEYGLIYCYDCNKYSEKEINENKKCNFCKKYNIEVICKESSIIHVTENTDQCERCLELMDTDEFHICNIDMNLPRCLYADGRGTCVCIQCERLFEDVDNIRGQGCNCLLSFNHHLSPVEKLNIQQERDQERGSKLNYSTKEEVERFYQQLFN